MSESAASERRGIGALDFRAWSNRERHKGSLIVAAVVAILLALGIALQFLAPAAAGGVLWALLALVVLALLYQVGVIVTGLRTEAASESLAEHATAEAEVASESEADSAWAPPAPGPEDAPAAPEPGEVQILTLRCGHCATEFEVRDDGTRPLYHTCPGCGSEGVLRGPAAGAAEPEAAPAPQAQAEPSAESSPWARPSGMPTPDFGEDAAPAAAPEPEPAPVKRVKLRCPGCKHVFGVDDTGERPLRTRCPSCNRLGEIRGK